MTTTRTGRAPARPTSKIRTSFSVPVSALPPVEPFAYLRVRGQDGQELLRLVYPLAGAERGYHTEGDIVPRVTTTADGTDLNDVWNDFQRTLDQWNDHRRTIMRHLSFRTTVSFDTVAQTTGGEKFEEASEFGVPKALRVPGEVLELGYSFKDYDAATRFTWKFLRDASIRQVEAIHNRVLEGDNRQISESVLWRMFDPTQGTTTDNGSGAAGHPIYGLFSGDGLVPPPFMGKTFTGSHTHYMTTQGALDAADVEDLINHVTEHGYGQTPGSQLLLFAHPDQGAIVQKIRAGAATAEAGRVATWDFIPSAGAPAYLTDQTIVGERAPGEHDGLKIAGSYGPAWLTESRFVPAGYVLLVASGGPDSDLNPVGFREHANVLYQGLRLIPGVNQRYPLIDGFYSRGYGTGVRHRGAAAVMQVTATGVTTYTAPPLPA